MFNYSRIKEKLDYYLVVATLILFTLLALIFLYATFFSWLKSISNPAWTSTYRYNLYIRKVNIATFGVTSFLLLALVICIERRSVKLPSSLLIVLTALAVGLLGYIIKNIQLGLLFSMVLVSFYQIYLLLSLFLGKSVKSSKEKHLGKAGSLILHTGYAIIVAAVGGLYSSDYLIPVFWLGTGLVFSGSILSFYEKNILKLTERFKQRLTSDRS